MANVVELQENGVPQYLKTHIQAVIGAYEVGDIHLSITASNPSARFGGTWKRFGAGRTLVSVDDDDTSLDDANKTGGSTNPVTNHTHTFSGTTSGTSIVAGNTSSPDVKFQGASSGSGLKSEAHSHSFSGTTASAGNNTGHANWQPFITVYMWVKTA